MDSIYRCTSNVFSAIEIIQIVQFAYYNDVIRVYCILLTVAATADETRTPLERIKY